MKHNPNLKVLRFYSIRICLCRYKLVSNSLTLLLSQVIKVLVTVAFLSLKKYNVLLKKQKNIIEFIKFLVTPFLKATRY